MLPKEVEQYIRQQIRALHADPAYQFTYQTRRQLYELLHHHDVAHPEHTRGYLALLSGQKVLPIFQSALPTERVPQRLLMLAHRVLQGTLRPDSPRITTYLELAYHATGNHWGRDEQTIEITARYAGTAAYKALLESLGHLSNAIGYQKTHVLMTADQHEQAIFDQIEHIFASDAADQEEQLTRLFREIPSIQETTICLDTDVQHTADQELTDADYAILGSVGDTAATAAFAFSCNEWSSICHNQQLHIFWRWWLTEALPEAWRRAHIEA